MSFCSSCGAQLSEGSKFCPKCGNPVEAAAAAPQQDISASIPDPSQEPVYYDGVCLKRENGLNTVPGDCLITPSGLFYYSRSKFAKQTGKRDCDFWVNSADVVDIQTTKKNMNKVMQLYMRDGSVLEFYSPKFPLMLSAMQKAVKK